jgi:hypothetical protein
MKRTFRIVQDWIIEVESEVKENHFEVLISRMLDDKSPLQILQAQQIVAKQLDTVVDYELIQTCRVCGCTDEDCSQCIAATGVPCHWVEDDLCSRCAPNFQIYWRESSIS